MPWDEKQYKAFDDAVYELEWLEEQLEKPDVDLKTELKSTVKALTAAFKALRNY